MIINTIFGKAKILFAGPADTVFVRLLDWTPQQIEKMGGEKEAWILISAEQILNTFEKPLDKQLNGCYNTSTVKETSKTLQNEREVH